MALQQLPPLAFLADQGAPFMLCQLSTCLVLQIIVREPSAARSPRAPQTTLVGRHLEAPHLPSAAAGLTAS